MAQRGRPFDPRNARFAVIDKHHGNCVYAALLGNGVVKVGMSRTPRIRMGSLANEVQREFGCDLSDWVLTPVGAMFSAEQALIRRVAAIGTPLPGRYEYFTGVSFKQAAAALADVSREFPRKSIERSVVGADPSTTTLRACHDADALFFADR